jgi:hypothetical protein
MATLATDDHDSDRPVSPVGGVDRRTLVVAMTVLGLVVAAWATVAIPARAVRATHTTADEPQYLLTALSLGEDLDLDISDELRDRRFEPFHEISLNPQTRPLEGGAEYSPHDPLLPVLLALPMRLGGWVAAKVALAALAGCLAATMLWVAVRRFAVALPVGVAVVGAFSLTPPLTTYGTQVYPELPAALVFTLAVAALTAPGAARRWSPQLLWLGALVALPWLSVKYVGVTAAIGLLGVALLVRERQVRRLAVLLACVAGAGVVYLALHQLIYGGWTVYAAGDHFVDGEAGVIGFQPNYLGRARRLTGLLVDNTYGIAMWAPVYFFAAAALGALVRRRPPGWLVLVLPLAAGWFTATFVAVTMHGWWWPGRQLVIVLPALVLATAWWVGRLPRVVPWLLGAAAVSVFFWAWLLVEVAQDDVTLIFNFEAHDNPVWQLWRDLLPPGRETGLVVTGLTVLWSGVVVAVALLGWRSVPAAPRVDQVAGRSGAGSSGADASGADASGGRDEDARPGELADADVATVDLDRGGAVG